MTNCYALPFEEDPKHSNVWFLDHTYHETMFNMFRKINAKEKFLGNHTLFRMVHNSTQIKRYRDTLDF